MRGRLSKALIRIQGTGSNTPLPIPLTFGPSASWTQQKITRKWLCKLNCNDKNLLYIVYKKQNKIEN